MRIRKTNGPDDARTNTHKHTLTCVHTRTHLRVCAFAFMHIYACACAYARTQTIAQHAATNARDLAHAYARECLVPTDASPRTQACRHAGTCVLACDEGARVLHTHTHEITPRAQPHTDPHAPADIG